jgi:hypothetical protein
LKLKRNKTRRRRRRGKHTNEKKTKQINYVNDE